MKMQWTLDAASRPTFLAETRDHRGRRVLVPCESRRIQEYTDRPRGVQQRQSLKGV